MRSHNRHVMPLMESSSQYGDKEPINEGEEGPTRQHDHIPPRPARRPRKHALRGTFSPTRQHNFISRAGSATPEAHAAGPLLRHPASTPSLQGFTLDINNKDISGNHSSLPHPFTVEK